MKNSVALFKNKFEVLLVMLAVIVLSFITGLFIAAVLFDVVPSVLTWLRRIHIGRWTDEKDWKKAVNSAGLKWLKKTPSVPVSDNTRLTIIERLRGSYKSKKIQAWQQAALLMGANDCTEPEAQRVSEAFIKQKIDFSTGEWKENINSVDSAMLAFAILSSRGIDKQAIRPAMKSTADMLFESALKYSTVPYDSSIPDIRFVDTVGMICPFLFLYAKEYNCPQAFELALRQLTEYLEFGVDKITGLPQHCFNKKNNARLGIAGWGRGCAWLCLALAESLNAVGESPAAAPITEKMKELAEKLVDYQLEEGAWSRQILGESVGESSATAVIGWFMKEAYKLTSQDKYKISFENAVRYLMSRTRRDGVVDFAQGDTKSIGFYSARLAPLPAAQGFAMKLTFFY
ncbi:MAG: hypothetical protein GX824_02750 [Clostridiales bacterium]|nr:hypothetical protein [Clostridiales bacterium]